MISEQQSSLCAGNYSIDGEFQHWMYNKISFFFTLKESYLLQSDNSSGTITYMRCGISLVYLTIGVKDTSPLSRIQYKTTLQKFKIYIKISKILPDYLYWVTVYCFRVSHQRIEHMNWKENCYCCLQVPWFVRTIIFNSHPDNWGL